MTLWKKSKVILSQNVSLYFAGHGILSEAQANVKRREALAREARKPHEYYQAPAPARTVVQVRNDQNEENEVEVIEEMEVIEEIEESQDAEMGDDEAVIDDTD